MPQSKFIKFRKSTIDLFNQYGISIKLNAILCFIVENHYKDHKLTVSEMISQKHLASQATIHASIKELISLNLVELVINSSDARIKYLVPTKTTLELFKKLDSLI
jgi:DNA-binding MarR family transcriptional regulator